MKELYGKNFMAPHVDAYEKDRELDLLVRKYFMAPQPSSNIIERC